VNSLVLVVTLLFATATRLAGDERVIIEAALGAPHEQLAAETMQAESVKALLAGFPLRPIARILGGSRSIPISSGLLASVRQHNEQPASLAGLTFVATRPHKGDTSVSRPGISRDGHWAFVLVNDGGQGGRGVLLEQIDRTWRVIAVGPSWVY
jgi:hypothetical protein